VGTPLFSINALGATWLAGVVLATSAAAPAQEPARRHVPNDPLFAQQWPLDNSGQGGGAVDADVDAPEAWAITRGSSSIVIAVLDDGVELEHPDLAPNIAAAGRDFRARAPRATAAAQEATDRHGTAVAGIVAARQTRGASPFGGFAVCCCKKGCANAKTPSALRDAQGKEASAAPAAGAGSRSRCDYL